MVSTSKYPSSDACTSPRARSRIEPSARTTVIALTHWRVTPYLNVAGPAALVAIVPPMNAPSKVGAGG